MKAVLTLEDFDKLSDDFKNEYTKSGEGYTLTVEGGEDTGALKRAKDHEKAARQTAEGNLTDLQGRYATQETLLNDMRKGNIPKADADALELSYKTKHDTMVAEKDAIILTKDTSLKSILVDNVAQSMANEISTVPSLMAEYLSKRLAAEVVDGKMITRVLDTAGQPTSLSVDDFKQEVIANEQFSGIIIASKASGSSASGSNKGGSGATSFKDMSEAERVTLAKSDPAKFKELRTASQQSQF